jgi:broad specificity phosphatase PhoE
MNNKMHSWIFSVIAVISLSLITQGSLTANENSGLKALGSGNHFAIMRHAIAPGFGDPSNFELRNCTTQRNLSQEGFDQAARIGKRFKENGISEASVYTSQWCRCIDTASTLDLGVPEELPSMNSFFETREREAIQMESLKDWLIKQDLTKPVVLVTHQVNMTALTGAYPASGEIFIIERTASGDFNITAKIQTK